MVCDDGQRSLLFGPDMAIQCIHQTAADHPSAVQLTGVYHNLLRRWADAWEWKSLAIIRVGSLNNITEKL